MTASRFLGFAGFVATIATTCAQPVEARQLESSPAVGSDTSALKVFLDCGACDPEYQRQNVTFIDYVRDRSVADLHVLVTTQDTGGGGMLWVVKFIGLGGFASQDRTFTFATPQRATADDRRREFGRVFRVGLVGYAAATAAAPQLDVTWRRPARRSLDNDRWRSWLFRISGGGSLIGEQLSTSRSHRVSVTGNRTTPNWKVNVTIAANADRRQFTLADRRLESRRDSWTVGSQIVKSLGSHAGAGFRSTIERSSFSNTNRSTTMTSGIEWDLFPYAEANRRSLTCTSESWG